MSKEEFAQHIVNAIADYAALRSAKVMPYEVVKTNGPNSRTRYSYAAALLVELDGGQTFHVEVTPA